MEKTLKFVATVGGSIAGLFTDMPAAIRLLVLLMLLDYFSGIGAAMIGHSPKSATGALSSKVGFAGLARKAMILVIVLLASILDSQIESAACTGAVCMFYIVNESISIVENAVLLGVPIPAQLLAVLEIAKDTAQPPADSTDKQ